jgi:molecular chaperone Hsp33
MDQSVPASDQVRRFIFENRPVRGHWVRLESAWQELRAYSDYPQPVRNLLGQATAACVLLAATLKFQGTLSLQLQGNGAVRLLLAQCTHDFAVRSVAQFDAGEVAALPATSTLPPGSPGIFHRLVGGEGKLVVTIEAEERGARYQGIVPLGGDSLAASLEAYFTSSEQLPTRVLLAADEHHAAGLLLQQLPAAGRAAAAGEEADADMEEIWQEAEAGIQRLGQHELLRCKVEELLGRAFGASDVRLFRGSPVVFACRCGPERVSGLLRSLGEEEVRDILAEQGQVTVTCEFCHRPYHFDAVDIGLLFAPTPDTGGSRSVH